MGKNLTTKRKLNFFNDEMRLYIAYCFTHPTNGKKIREIKCEECGSYIDLDFHHKKYAPKEKVYLEDIRIGCCRCHRNSKPALKRRRSQLRTIFIKGKRYCETAKYKFEY